MISKNIFKEKSFEFAVKVVQTYKYLVPNKKEFVMSQQLLRSGTELMKLCTAILKTTKKINN